jgi:hypothetical protein
MQFRPVGIECPGEELTPEGADFSEKGVDRRSRLPAWAEKDSDVMVAITRPAFFDRDFCRSERLFWR